MDRHAFLIISHNEFELLQELVSALDHPSVDIFIHVDAKVSSVPTITSDKSKIFFVENRVDTRWGDVSQIETEYAIFEYAFNKGDYSFYHLISGVHYPLKDISSILDYFDHNKGKTVCSGLCRSTKYQETLKLHRFNFFTRNLAFGSKTRRVLAQRLWRLLLLVQDKLNVYRNPDIEFYKASNWISIPRNILEYVLSQKTRVLQVYKYSFCGDEYFIPTLLMASEYKDTIVNNDDLLFVKFGDANPRVLTIEDYDEIRDSGCLFARKFSANNMDVINKIKNNLLINES